MKTPIIFNLDNEIIDLIKEETDNRSNWLNGLLKEHFETSKPLKQIHEEKIKLSKQLLEEAEKIEEDITNEEKMQEELNMEQQEARNRMLEEKRKRNREKLIEAMKEVFATYDVPDDKIADEVKEFFEIVDGGLQIRPVQYMQDRGFKKKEPFKPKI